MMLEYVRAELLRRLKMRQEVLRYTAQVDAKYRALEERRMVERLLHAPRKAA